MDFEGFLNRLKTTEPNKNLLALGEYGGAYRITKNTGRDAMPEMAGK